MRRVDEITEVEGGKAVATVKKRRQSAISVKAVIDILLRKRISDADIA